MATLRSGAMALEIEYRTNEDRFLFYHVRWLWNDVPVLNDAVVNREPPWAGVGSKGAWLAFDTEGSSLPSVIARALEADELGRMTTDDPDMTIAVGPYPLSPIFDSPMRAAYTGLGDKPTRRQERRKKILGKLPEDLFEIVVFFDAHDFWHPDTDTYTESGLCLRMPVVRRELHHFAMELAVEYAEFCGSNKLVDWTTCEDDDDDEPETYR